MVRSGNTVVAAISEHTYSIVTGAIHQSLCKTGNHKFINKYKYTSCSMSHALMDRTKSPNIICCALSTNSYLQATRNHY